MQDVIGDPLVGETTEQNHTLPLDFSHQGELLPNVCVQNSQTVSPQSFSGEQIQTLFTLHFNTHVRAPASVRSHTLSESAI